MLARHPQAVAPAALGQRDLGDARGVELAAFAAGAGEGLRVRRDRLRIEADTAGGAETRGLGVAREALGADQRERALLAHHLRAAVAAGLRLRLDVRAARRTAQDLRVLRLQRAVLELLAAAASEALVQDERHVVLGVAFRTGDELHAGSWRRR